jgi:hypothetical protein
MPLDSRAPISEQPLSRRLVRLAIVIHLLGDLQHDWYAVA